MSVLKSQSLPVDHENITTLFHHTTDGAVMQESHDVSGILKANHFQRTTQGMRHDSETVNHVARIDTLAIKNWMAQRGVTKNWWFEFFNDDKLLTEFLNDPDNECWRTRKGKI